MDYKSSRRGKNADATLGREKRLRCEECAYTCDKPLILWRHRQRRHPAAFARSVT